ncbi:MAG: hypothetical protein FJ027_19145, partial [Candidatus Rokubacteria bacterium]|nr:hypothetical protein [Candidatus Rokubacteria bacterium]
MDFRVPGGDGGSIFSRPSAAERAAERASVLAGDAAQLEREGKDEAALGKLLEAVRETPNDAGLQASVRRVRARVANARGLAAYSRNDYVAAAAAFRDALTDSPDHPVITQNLKNAEDNARTVRDRQQRVNAVSERIDAMMSGMARELGGAPGSASANTGGLGFMPSPPPAPASTAPVSGAPVAAPAANTASGRTAAIVPPSSDPLIVDTRGAQIDLRLPKLDEIETSPAAGEARKAMIAVVERDWEIARVWFQQALIKDPANAALRRSADLADWTYRRQKEERAANQMFPLIDLAFEARARNDVARYRVLITQVMAHPQYRAPDTELFKRLVDDYYHAQTLGTTPAAVAAMTPRQRENALMDVLFREMVAEDAARAA